ncbi:hypothetical protein J4442_05035 [Candidatus Woesearchaeota archaeon]|nr:hypothetical protein [Candidatus Woesearchaeota archaeon]
MAGSEVVFYPWLFEPEREKTCNGRYNDVRWFSIDGWMVGIGESDPVERISRGIREIRTTYLYDDGRGGYHPFREEVLRYKLR